MNDTGIEYMIIIFVKCSVFKIAISNIHLYVTKTYIFFRIAYGKKTLVMSPFVNSFKFQKLSVDILGGNFHTQSLFNT